MQRLIQTSACAQPCSLEPANLLLYKLSVTFPLGTFQVRKRLEDDRELPYWLWECDRLVPYFISAIGINMSFKVIGSFCLTFTQANSNYSMLSTTSEMICLWFASGILKGNVMF